MTNKGARTVLLIGGAGRSGSTLLDRLLGQLPGFVAVGELRYLWSEALGDNQLCGCGARFLDCPFWLEVGKRAYGGWDEVDQQQAISMARSVARHRYIPFLAMGDTAPERYRRRLARYLGMLAPLYAAISDVSRANVIVDSTKDAAYAHVLRRMPNLDFRLLHLVRDSRGVAWSWAKLVPSQDVAGREHYMRQFSPPVTGLRWMTFNLMVESLEWFGVPRLLLRYETLVANPSAALAAIASFVGRPAPAEALTFLKGNTAQLGVHHTVAGNPMRLKAGDIDIRVDEAWRTSMPFGQRAGVAALTWPLLRHYSDSVGRWPAGAGRATPNSPRSGPS
jgi:hypothetical protein